MIPFDFETLRLDRFENDRKTILQEIEMFHQLYEEGNRLDPLALYEQAQECVTKVEHGSGGYGVFRGYYCPSMYQPLNMGERRGKVLKRVTKRSRVSYEFGYKGRNLFLVKRFADPFFEDGEKGTPVEVEFIQRKGDMEIGLQFNWQGDHELEMIHVCQYDGDWLVNVRTFGYYGEWKQNPGQNRKMGLPFVVYQKEWLEYQGTQLKRVNVVEYNNMDADSCDVAGDTLIPDRITFIHDNEGNLVQYFYQDEHDCPWDMEKEDRKYYQETYVEKAEGLPPQQCVEVEIDMHERAGAATIGEEDRWHHDAIRKNLEKGPLKRLENQALDSFDFETLRLERYETGKEALHEEAEQIYRMCDAVAKLDPLELYEKAQENTIKVEQGSGGYSVSRGYYCPSVYNPIAVGGCSRGKVLKRVTKRSRISYEFCHGEKGLIMVKEFPDTTVDVNEGEDGIVCGVEFIERKGDIEVGFRLNWDHEFRGELSVVHVCQYDGDRLVNVREFICGAGWQEQPEIKKRDFHYQKEWLEYEDGRLKRVKNVEYSAPDLVDMKLLDEDYDNINDFFNDIFEEIYQENPELRGIMGVFDYDGRTMDEITLIYDEDGIPVQFYQWNETDCLYDVTKEEQKYYRETHLGR